MEVENGKKKLLIYAHYYWPDVASTGQILQDLAEGMLDEFEITVICAVPSYTGQIEACYLKQTYYFEEYGGIKLIRVKVPPFDKAKKSSRIKHILVYFYRSVFATFKAPKPDYILTISQPPILGGMLGVIGKHIERLRGKKTKMFYNIQDFNPEQTMAVGYSKNKFILKLMMGLDKHTCKVADKVVVVGSDMVRTMRKRFSKSIPDTVLIHNWMDENSIRPLQTDHEKVLEFKRQYGLENKLVVMYSGNVGLYYDLPHLVEVMGRFRTREDVVFVIVGEGACKKDLTKYVEEQKIPNIVFVPYREKEELIYSLNAADIQLVANAKGIKGISMPSKLYGVMAAGKPILGILEQGTDARYIIELAACGYVADPGDYDKIAELLEKMSNERETLPKLGLNGRLYLEAHLTKEAALERYRQEVFDT